MRCCAFHPGRKGGTLAQRYWSEGADLMSAAAAAKRSDPLNGLTSCVRELEPGDWSAVADIYWDGMRDGLATFETEVPDWPTWDASHLVAHRLVPEAERGVVGWAALAPASSRRCYAGVAESSVYVARDERGRGVGRMLLQELIAGAKAAELWTIQCSVFPENRASLALHERCGFRIVGTRERIARRDGIWRNTVLLEKRL